MSRIVLIVAFLVTTIFSSSAAFAQYENPDVQSPEEIRRANAAVARDFANAKTPAMLSLRKQSQILDEYSHLDPKREVPTDLLKDAVLYFAANKSGFPNKNYITIVDFAPRSDKYRFFLVDMKTGAVEKYHTTHGVGSDEGNFAKYFGNIVNSGKSSLGYARTAEVYSGKFKRSLRLDGLSQTNSKIRERAVVYHGWDHVKEANVIQGLSWGCITIDWALKDAILDKIKEGSLMYVGVSKL